MVHALEEIWRTLKPSGFLLDLRPLHNDRPLAVVTDKQMIALAPIDESSELVRDRDSAAAINRVVQDGRFVRNRQITFDHAWYWDDVPDMLTYFDNRNPPTILPDEQLADIQQQHQLAGASARLRMTLTMTIGRYRKL